MLKWLKILVSRRECATLQNLQTRTLSVIQIDTQKAFKRCFMPGVVLPPKLYIDLLHLLFKTLTFISICTKIVRIAANWYHIAKCLLVTGKALTIILLWNGEIKNKVAVQYNKDKYFKGTDHDFCWSGKPIYHLQKQGNIHIFQIKKQNPINLLK